MSDPLLDLAISLKRDERPDRLKGALDRGMQFDPDAYAKAVKVSAQTGVVPTAVMRDQKAFDKTAFRVDPAQMVNLSPRVADWLVAHDDNAPQAYDDLPALAKLEAIYRDVLNQRDLILPKFFGGTARAFGGAVDWAGAKMQESSGQPGYQYWKPLADQFRQTGQDVRKFWAPIFEDPANQPQTGLGQVTGFVGDVGSMMGKAYLAAQTGGAAVPLLFGAEGFGEAAGSALETGKTPNQAGWRGAGHGTLNAALAFIPGGKFGGEAALGEAIAQGGKGAIAKELVKGLAVRGARGTVLGTGMTWAGNAINRVTGDPTTPWNQGLEGNIASFIGMEGAGYLGHAIKATAESRLKARSPETFQNAADHLFKDSPIEDTMMDATKFQTLFQEAGVDPAVMAEKLGVKNYTEALAAGTEIIIPTSKFLAHLTPEQQNAMLPDLRTGLGEATPREKEAYQKEAGKVDLKAQVEPVDKTAYTTIYEDMLAQLHDVGHSGKYAEDQADLHARVMVNMGKMFGKDPIALAQERGLRIYRPAPSEGGNPVDISLGRMGRGDALEAQDFHLDPAMDPRYWQTAVDAEVQKSAPNLETPEFKSWFGGSQAVDESGKPKVFYHGTMDEFSQFKPSDRGIFFSEKPDFASFFGRGNDGRMIPAYLKVEHPFDYQNPKDLEAYQAWKGREAAPDAVAKGEFDVLESPDFQKFLKESGYDGFYVEENGVRNLAVFDPTQIKSALTNTGAFDPKNPEIYFQPAYHGSPYRFDKFTTDHIGKGEGAQAYGWGLYFAGSKDVAEYYRKALGGKAGIPLSEMRSLLNEAKGGSPFPEPFDGHYEIRRQVRANPDASPEEIAKKSQYASTMLREIPIEKLAEIVKRFKDADTGQTYKVDIPEDGQYLLWDKPLSEQPEAVREGLRKVLDNLGSDDETFWERDLQALDHLAGGNKKPFKGEDLYSDVGSAINGTQEDASKLLNSFGIVGIKYEDGNTRASDGEKSFNYVIFDANAVNTLETYYQSAPSPLGFYSALERTIPDLFQREKRVGWDHRGSRKRYSSPEEKMSANMRKLSLRSDASFLKAKSEWLRAEDAASKAANDEFLKWEADVKATQAGDILGDKRGFIQFSPDHKTSIALLEKANFTTLTHELGHEYLSLLGRLADEPGAAGVGVESYKSVLKFLGVEDSSQITTAHHEKFADAAIGYFLEGKAPTPELRGTFQRMKYWMMTAYRNLQALGVKLSPEIRGVFDRLFAGEAAVEEASKVVDLKPMFTTAEDMNTTSAVFDAYAKLSEKARSTANEAVESKLMREFQREKEAWWKVESAKVEEDVTAEVNAEPVYQAFKALTDGKLEDGTPIKLNKDALEAQFGAGVGKELPRSKGWLYTREGGMDAEAAAEILGFNSGDHLIESLKGMEPRRERISRLTDERMKTTHGDMMTDGTLAETAIEAIHNQAREEMKMAELRELRRMQRIADPVLAASAKEESRLARENTQNGRMVKTGEFDSKGRPKYKKFSTIPPKQAFVDAAREIVDGTSPRDLQPYRYLQASERLGKESATAFAKKDYQAAGDAKQKEILNHHLYLEATKARAEALDIAEYGREGQTPKFQGKLGKAGQEYRGQWNALASRYEFRKVTNLELDARAQSLSDWVKANVDDGAEIDSSILVEGQVKNWREVPMAELRAVKDALKNIETVAKHQLGATLDGRHLDYETEIADLDTTARAVNTSKMIPRMGAKLTALEQAKSSIQGFVAYSDKMEWFVNRLDGGDINGPARRNIKKPIDDAAGREHELGNTVKLGLIDLFSPMTGADKRAEFDLTKVQFPNHDRPLNRLQLKSWIMLLGSEEGAKVATLGENLVNEDGSFKPEFHAALGSLTLKEANQINGVWKLMESLRPLVEAKYLHDHGYEMKTKTVVPFTIKTVDGETVEMTGGYFPQAPDPTVSATGKRVADVNAGIPFRPTTSQGHTIAVTGQVYPPILDYHYTLGKHLPAVIKDVTAGEAVAYVSKFLMNEKVQKIIGETLGPKKEAEFMPWLQGFVDNGVDRSNEGPILNFLLNRRIGMVVAKLGGNLGSFLIQGGDSLKLLADVGSSSEFLMKHYPQALIDLRAGGDVGGTRMTSKQIVEEIRRLSPNEMRYREQSAIREMREILQSKNLFEQGKQSVSEWVMQSFLIADRLQTFPAWLARYREGLATHGDESVAVMEADRLISRAFQAGEARNMSRMMRSPGWTKLFTTFGGDQNTWFGLVNASIESGSVQTASIAIMALILDGVLATTIRKGLPKKEDIGTWSVNTAVSALLNPFGMFGDFAQTSVNAVQGKFAQGTNPTLDAIEKVFKDLPRSARAYSQGKKDGQAFAIDAIEAVGLWTGAPGTGQIVKGWKYQHDVMTGKRPHPANAYENVRNTLLGPPPKGK